MNKLAKIALSTLLATSGLLAVGTSANAMPSDIPALDGKNISCSIRIIEEGKPAVPEVPAVYETLHEFVHAHNDKLEPRWEKEGWNADSNPNSQGWVSTGNTKQGELISPAVPAVPAVDPVTEEECITQEPTTPVTPPVTEQPEVPVFTQPEVPVFTKYPTCDEIGQTEITPNNPAYHYSLDIDRDGIACEADEVTVVVGNTGGTTPEAANALTQPSVTGSVPVAAVSGDTDKPAQLANTGFNWGAFVTAMLALGAGFGLLRLKNKLT